MTDNAPPPPAVRAHTYFTERTSPLGGTIQVFGPGECVGIPRGFSYIEYPALLASVSTEEDQRAKDLVGTRQPVNVTSGRAMHV